MNHIRRIACILAGLISAVLASASTSPAAFAMEVPPQPAGWNQHPPLPPAHIHYPVHVPDHTVVIGGMPGWQIALIAIGAALFAAALAVTLDRTRTAHQQLTAPDA